MDAPGLQWRGSTSAPFPGYLLIGRGEDFATTLTSAGGDIIDQYVEKLCNGSDQMYQYKGECLPMENFNAGTLNGKPVTFLRTVHGPVVGYATVNGERVAISSKRSSYGRRHGPDLLPAPVHGPGRLPEVVLQGGGADAADLQLVLHRPQEHRRLRQRAAAAAAQERRSQAADAGHGAVRVDRLPVRQEAPPGNQSPQRDDRQLEQRIRSRVRGRRQRLGPQRDRAARRHAEPQHAAPRDEERQVGPRRARRGDERRRDPGRPRDRQGAAAAAAC